MKKGMHLGKGVSSQSVRNQFLKIGFFRSASPLVLFLCGVCYLIKREKINNPRNEARSISTTFLDAE